MEASLQFEFHGEIHQFARRHSPNPSDRPSLFESQEGLKHTALTHLHEECFAPLDGRKERHRPQGQCQHWDSVLPGQNGSERTATPRVFRGLKHPDRGTPSIGNFRRPLVDILSLTLVRLPLQRKNRDFSRFLAVVPVEGLEPPLPCGKQILSLSRLPFRHTGRCCGGGEIGLPAGRVAMKTPVASRDRVEPNRREPEILWPLPTPAWLPGLNATRRQDAGAPGSPPRSLGGYTPSPICDLRSPVP